MKQFKDLVKAEQLAVPLKEPSYPLVPSKKDKERYFKRFLEIFKRLEITMPFGEALQPMVLYTRFMKDILTKKGNYIDNENIMVGGNYSVVIQRKLPEKFKDLGSVDKEDVDILQTTSLDKALINVVNCLPSEEEKDIRSCLEELDREGHIHAEGTNCKELRSRNPSERTKLVVPDASPPSQVAHHQQESTSSAPDTHSQMLRSLYQGQQIII
ncbi:hypothetical protein GmHk_16G046907 [Glycine max]|nr:hypothetical protein GmHk_16G046907 [Glycine max]